MAGTEVRDSKSDNKVVVAKLAGMVVMMKLHARS